MNLKASIVRGLNRHVLPRYRLTLRKSGNEADNLPAPGRFRDRLVGNTALLLQPWLNDLGDGDARTLVEEFLELFPTRPVRDNTGGSGFNGSLSLFAAVRVIGPGLIVESGTWKGHTAWLFRQAAPRARIVSFDIEHENLEHREPGIDYRLGDWMTHEITAGDGVSLMFLDDHISHARRIREAHARGFRLLITDDDLPAEALCATGLPPAPTAAMLADPSIQAGEVLSWRYRERDFSLVVEAADLAVRSLIAERHAAPDLSPATCHARHNGLSVLRLRDS